MTKLSFTKNPVTKKHLTATRLKNYTIKEIFDFCALNETHFDPKINIQSAYNKKGEYVKDGEYLLKIRRAKIFLKTGLVCCHCRVEGKYFGLDKWENGQFHLELYGIDSCGEEVVMTIDHIHPKSRGGPGSINNFQTLCIICNEKKGNVI